MAISSLPDTTQDASLAPGNSYRIQHLITGLNTGGAETVLAALLPGLGRAGFECRVISLIPPGPVGEVIQSQGIPVSHLGMRRGMPGPAAVIKLVRRLRRFRPHLLQTWMYHSDLLGLIAGRIAGIHNIVWNIRCANVAFEQYSRFTVLALKACARLSKMPTAVVTNSYAARDVHRSAGYKPHSFPIIPNGFDLECFKPDAKARDELRRELGVSENTVLIGLVARFDYMKDHATFCRAAGIAAASGRDCAFLLCGYGTNPDNPDLMKMLNDAGIADKTLLLDRREDIPRINAALDLACCTSVGESFPNVVGEAMACGTPCLVTDVGDAARIVGETGRIVNVGDYQAAGREFINFIDMPSNERRALGEACRARIREHYSLQAMVNAYTELYSGIIAGRTAR